MLYPLAMGLTLIATGEHYFFDVLLGWLYAGAAMAAWGWWERTAPEQRDIQRARPSGDSLPVVEASNRPERLNREGLVACAERAADGKPVVMLNLLRFRPDGGEERYGEYTAAVTPLVERIGGRIIFSGLPGPALLGSDSWDLVALVEYPSRQAFLDMVASAEYQAIGHLRTEALLAGELHPIDPAGVAIG